MWCVTDLRSTASLAVLISLSVLLLLLTTSCSRSPDAFSQSSTLFLHHVIEGRYPHGHISSQYAADIDRDEFLDIVIRSGKSGPPEIAWYQNPLGQKGKVRAAWRKIRISRDGYPSGAYSSGTGLLVYDINRDGRQDVITGAYVEGIGNGLFWWESPENPFTEAWKRYLIAAPNIETKEEYAPHDLRMADIDLDGREDLIIGGSSHQGVYWARIPKKPTTLTSWPLFRVDAPRKFAFAGLAVGDIDQDGRTDIVRSDVWYQSTGPITEPRWQPHLYGLINVPPSNLELFDIDRDHYLDIVVASGHNAEDGEVIWYKATADPTRPWLPHRIAKDLAAPENLIVMAGDSPSTIFVLTAELDFQNKAEKRKVVLYQTTTATTPDWTETVLYQGHNFHMLRAADLDNDGDLDFYGASFEEKNGFAHVDWFENLSTTQRDSIKNLHRGS